jgi:hypothetical protein
MARETGLEPATSGVTGRRSNQLSYSPATRLRNGRTGNLPDRIGAGPSQARREASPAAGRRPCPGASAATHRPSRRAAQWWAVTGSNRRPSRCKRDALPAELTARDRSFMQIQMVAHWVSRVNAVAGYPVDVPVQTITRAGCRGPGRRAPLRHRSSSRAAPRRAAPQKRKRQTGRPERSRPACRWTPPSRSISAPKRRLLWRTARASRPG